MSRNRTLNDNWRDAQDKNKEYKQLFTFRVYSCNRLRATVWWNHWLGLKLITQIYLHVVTDVATCDKFGPDGFLAMKDKAAAFVDPVIDLYKQYKTLTWES